ncbi:MAG TPA: MmcQ/YjbR family DNA-binding protein [Rhizobiaceae bacterium]|nr:MmcQ/YjbR family DNA-binding protein [Rhizobiaceae bacterium]
MSDNLQPAFAKLVKAAAGLPEVEESSWFGTPSLKVRGKGFARVKDPDTVVLMCSLEDKELLFETAPEIFFETDHYKGWPAILVRIKKISPKELKHRLAIAWRLKAPKKLAKQVEGGSV